jgi:hypothetical protein
MCEQVVVVGVDGSPASYTALQWALAHAPARCWPSPRRIATRRTLTRGDRGGARMTTALARPVPAAA